MSIFGDTLNNFFGDEIDENEKIRLGNEIIAELKELGFDFKAQRQILRGEQAAELPEALTEKLSRYQAMIITELPEVDVDAKVELAQRDLARSIQAENWYE